MRLPLKARTLKNHHCFDPSDKDGFLRAASPKHVFFPPLMTACALKRGPRCAASRQHVSRQGSFGGAFQLHCAVNELIYRDLSANLTWFWGDRLQYKNLSKWAKSGLAILGLNHLVGAGKAIEMPYFLAPPAPRQDRRLDATVTFFKCPLWLLGPLFQLKKKGQIGSFLAMLRQQGVSAPTAACAHGRKKTPLSARADVESKTPFCPTFQPKLDKQPRTCICPKEGTNCAHA